MVLDLTRISCMQSEILTHCTIPWVLSPEVLVLRDVGAVEMTDCLFPKPPAVGMHRIVSDWWL